MVAIDAVGATIDLSTTPMIGVAPARSDLVSRLAVNIHFTRDDAGLDAAMGMGFSRVRMDFSWSAVEATKGVYNFSDHDALVASLAARGMTPHLILDYGNRFYPPTGDAAFVSITVPAFAAYAKAAAAHFAGKGVTFEIWNEANLPHFWMSTPSAFQENDLTDRLTPTEASKPKGVETELARALSRDHDAEGRAADHIYLAVDVARVHVISRCWHWPASSASPSGRTADAASGRHFTRTRR